jgi:4-hydroxybenzoate polyprenyltransferase
MIFKIFISMRPLQWIKNLFIFFPIIFSGVLFNKLIFLEAINTFFVFSIVSSAVYMFNDIIDFKADNQHPIKMLRPIPSRQVSIKLAYIVIFLLLAGSFFISLLFINIYISIILFIYVILNVSYSLLLKKIVILDAFIIAIGFVLRMLTGTVIATTPPSPWILLTTFFLALFISFGKRLAEIKELGNISLKHRVVLKNYSVFMLEHIISTLMSIIIVCYSLYTFSESVSRFGGFYMVYTTPIVVYGLFRYFYLIFNKGLGGNPSEILFIDKHLFFCFFLWIISCITIIYLI